jgi:PAS domain S-box-containing protein
MSAERLFERYRELQEYVHWTTRDAARLAVVAPSVVPRIDPLIDEFYAEIERHPEAARVITGGPSQVAKLKLSLREWLSESLVGRGDAQYVARRWKIGWRHAEIGLNPAFVAAAMSLLRAGLTSLLADQNCPPEQLRLTVESLNKLLDVELAIIQDAYEAEHLRRERDAIRERSEAKFRMLVEAAGCMVAIVRPDRSVSYFSPYSEQLTGFSADAIVGQDFLTTLIPPEWRADVASEIGATLAGQPTRAHETQILCRDRTLRWLVWNAQRLEDFEGAPAVLCVGQDFTERRDAQERLLRSERLAAIGQMITGLAHESRNALQRIQSCSEMLELEVQDNEGAVSLVRRLQEAQDHLLRLFDEVRGYAAPIQLERVPCNIEAAWREAWELLENSRRERDVSLVEAVDGADHLVPIDRFRLVQLFRILFENSLAACRDPATIEIVCRDARHAAGECLEVRVQDNGPGLSPQARQNVFEPFFTTKTKGTGLGMAIARRIVDAHGGQIIVGRETEGGAEFIVTLPRTVP